MYKYNVFLFVFLAFIHVNCVDAKVIFNGDWENYIGPFYSDQSGWKGFGKIGKPTQYGWNDFIGFWDPKIVPHTWKYATSFSSSSIKILYDDTSPHEGYVARFQVKPGDKRISYNGERAEFYKMLGDGAKKLPVTEISGHEFYGVSVKVKSDWESPKNLSATQGGHKWGVFLQLHSPNIYHSPPAIALAAEDQFSLHINTGELTHLVPSAKGGVRRVNKNSIVIPFKKADLAKGMWVQFMLDVRWSKEEIGHIKIYRRDENQDDFDLVLNLAGIPTLQYSNFKICKQDCGQDNQVHYWRIGFYRSASEDIENILWLGPLVRGDNFDEVARFAFGSSGNH